MANMDTCIIASNGRFPNGDKDALAFLSRLHGGELLTDRFGLLNRTSRWRMGGAFRPMPQPQGEGSAREFSDILDAEVQKVLARGEEVTVAWSGGLDSSCLLCGFLRSGMERERLHVVHSALSAEEFPALYRQLQREGVHLIETDTMGISRTCAEALERGTLCMGWHGDQLYGRLLLQRFPQIAVLPWQDACALLGAKLGWGEVSEAVGQLEEAFARYGAPVHSGAQLAWWQSFAACWHMRAGSEGVFGLGHGERVADVFGAEAFQRWSVARAADGARLADLSPAGCKPEMKAVILDVTKDADWVASRVKSSMGRAVWPRADEREPELVVFTEEGVERFRYPVAVHPSRRAAAFRRLCEDILPRWRKEI